MCKFMSSFPKQTDIIGATKNKNLEMFLQPCKGNDIYYRVRLLAFESRYGRKDPHITRFVHRAWYTDPKTDKKSLHKIVCTRLTPWAKVEGSKQSSCKVCNYDNQQWSIYNESGKSDDIARKNASSMVAQYEAIIPVYVRTDPNYDKNNGKFKVIIINDKKMYEKFRNAINAKLDEDINVFNGVNAVDCLIHVGTEELTTKSGKPFSKTIIDKIKFSTEPKNIPMINADAIDEFPFDETYYQVSSREEIEDFYNKFCAISNDDIPDDDIPIYKTSKSSDPVENTLSADKVMNASKSNANEDLDALVSDDLLSDDDELTSDPDEKDLAVPETDEKPVKAAPAKEENADDILADLGI